MTMPDRRNIWESYTASWLADQDDARLDAYKACLVDDCVYKDPNIEARGYTELASYMATFQQQMPGGHFVTRQFVTHHDSALVHWDMVDRAGTVISPGTSIGVFGDDGRLKAMTGFFDPQPAG